VRISPEILLRENPEMLPLVLRLATTRLGNGEPRGVLNRWSVDRTEREVEDE